MPKVVIPKSDQAKAFKLFRRHKKLTQKEIAVLVKKEQGTIGKYERGELFIPGDVVKKLHDLLGMSYEFFYDRKGPMEDKGEKQSMVTDLKNLLNIINQQGLRIETLEKQVKTLTRDLYADKHNV